MNIYTYLIMKGENPCVIKKFDGYFTMDELFHDDCILITVREFESETIGLGMSSIYYINNNEHLEDKVPAFKTFVDEIMDNSFYERFLEPEMIGEDVAVMPANVRWYSRENGILHQHYYSFETGSYFNMECSEDDTLIVSADKYFQMGICTHFEPEDSLNKISNVDLLDIPAHIFEENETDEGFENDWHICNY